MPWGAQDWGERTRRDPRMSICQRHCFRSRGPPASMWRMLAIPGACRRLPLRRIGSALVLAFPLIMVGGGRAAAARAAPAPQIGAVTTPAGEEQATVLADQILQVGGPTDLMIAVGNVEITRGQSRLLADRVEINRDTGQAVAQGKVVFYDGPDRLVGERIDYNLKTGTGVVYQGSAGAAPLYHPPAQRMDRGGDSVFELRRGGVPTPRGEQP